MLIRWLAAIALFATLAACEAGGSMTPPPARAVPPPPLASAADAPAAALAGGRSTTLAPASAGSRRYALVFGNGAYAHGDALAGAPRDAALIASALRERGYEVLLAIDRDLDGMREDVAAFETMSADAELRVLYFAGHGFEFEHANYLMPVDLPAAIGKLDRQAVRNNGVRLDELVWTLGQGTPALVAIIDACRVAPARGVQAARALGELSPARGTILAYATAPGRVALDSLRSYGVDADHSPYSYFLASALGSREVASWDQAFLSAASIVMQQTHGAQQPWMNAQVDRFPQVGAPAASTDPARAGTTTLLGLEISPERRAAGRYWARQAQLARTMAQDGSRTDASLEEQAARGESNAALALATRAWERGDTADALRRLEVLARAGHAVARTDLGTLLHSLKASDSEGHVARYWWQLASAQGIGEARAKLALAGNGDDEAAMMEFMRGLVETHEAFAPAGAGADP